MFDKEGFIEQCRTTSPNPNARDERLAQQLHEASLEMVGLAGS